MKITELTPEQIAQFPVYRKKWIDIGLSCEPLDFERAKAAAIKVYESAGLPPPRYFFYFDSPVSAAIAAIYIKQIKEIGPTPDCQEQAREQVREQVRGQVENQVKKQVWDQVRRPVRNQVWGQVGDQVGNQVRDQVRDQVWDQVGDQVWDQVRDQVRDQVWEQVGDQVWDQVRNQVGDQVWNQVWDQVGDQVLDQVGDQVWDQVRNQVWEQVGGQVGDQVRKQVWEQVLGSHEADWLAFYDFFCQVCQLECTDRLADLMELAECCGRWAPYQNVVIFQQRHSELHFDENGLLHCETGPAIKYRDGFSVYAWHGTRLPGEWFTAPPTAKELLAWPNVEQRRAGFDMIGWDTVLDELKATLIDADRDQQIGELYEVDLPDSGRERFLRVICGTGRTFVIPVPPEMQTARAANAWSYGLDTDQYQPELRT